MDKYHDALDGHRQRLSLENDRLVDSLKHEAGGLDAYLERRRENDNEQLNNLVLNQSDLHKIIKRNGMLIRKMDPAYMYPAYRNGRAHFYASVKQVGNLSMSTFVFNVLAIWIMSIILYFLLRYSILRKAIDFFGDLKRKE